MQKRAKTPPKEYDVTIEARIRKTVRVKAGNEEYAVRMAHEQFSVSNDDTPEDYEQETLKVEVVR